MEYTAKKIQRDIKKTKPFEDGNFYKFEETDLSLHKKRLIYIEGLKEDLASVTQDLIKKGVEDVDSFMREVEDILEKTADNNTESRNHLKDLQELKKAANDLMKDYQARLEEEVKILEESNISGFTELGIDNKTLFSVAGFFDLTDAQQVLVLKDLQQIFLGEVQRNSYGKDISRKQQNKDVGAIGYAKNFINNLPGRKEGLAIKDDRQALAELASNKELQIRIINGLVEQYGSMEAEIRNGQVVIDYTGLGKLTESVTDEQKKAMNSVNEAASHLIRGDYKLGKIKDKLTIGQNRRREKELLAEFEDSWEDIEKVWIEKCISAGENKNNPGGDCQLEAKMHFSDIKAEIETSEFIHENPKAASELLKIKQGGFKRGLGKLARNRRWSATIGASVKIASLIAGGPLTGTLAVAAGLGALRGSIHGSTKTKEAIEKQHDLETHSEGKDTKERKTQREYEQNLRDVKQFRAKYDFILKAEGLTRERTGKELREESEEVANELAAFEKVIGDSFSQVANLEALSREEISEIADIARQVDGRLEALRVQVEKVAKDDFGQEFEYSEKQVENIFTPHAAKEQIGKMKFIGREKYEALLESDKPDKLASYYGKLDRRINYVEDLLKTEAIGFGDVAQAREARRTLEIQLGELRVIRGIIFETLENKELLEKADARSEELYRGRHEKLFKNLFQIIDSREAQEKKKKKFAMIAGGAIGGVMGMLGHEAMGWLSGKFLGSPSTGAPSTVGSNTENLQTPSVGGSGTLSHRGSSSGVLSHHSEDFELAPTETTTSAHFEETIDKGESIWDQTKKLLKDSGEKFGLGETAYHTAKEAGQTKLSFEAWLDQKTNLLVVQLAEKGPNGKLNIKDLVHEGDKIKIDIASDGKTSLTFSADSEESAEYLSDKNVTGNEALKLLQGYDLDPNVVANKIVSKLGDVGMEITRPNGEKYQIFDWDRDGKPNVIMPDGSMKEISVSDYRALMEEENIFKPHFGDGEIPEPALPADTLGQQTENLIEEKKSLRDELFKKYKIDSFEDLPQEAQEKINYSGTEKDSLELQQALNNYTEDPVLGAKNQGAEILLDKIDENPDNLNYLDVRKAATDIYSNLLDKELHEKFLKGSPDHKDLFELTARLSNTTGLKPQESGLFAEYLYQGAKKMSKDTFESMMSNGHFDQGKFVEKLISFKQEALNNTNLPDSEKWIPRTIHYEDKNYLGLVRKLNIVSQDVYQIKISTANSMTTDGEQLRAYIDQAGENLPKPPAPEIKVEIEPEITATPDSAAAPEAVETPKSSNENTTETKSGLEKKVIAGSLSFENSQKSTQWGNELMQQWFDGEIKTKEQFIQAVEKNVGNLSDLEKWSWSGLYDDFHKGMKDKDIDRAQFVGKFLRQNFSRHLLEQQQLADQITK